MVVNIDPGDVQRRRDQVVHETLPKRLAVLVVGDLPVHRGAASMKYPSTSGMNLDLYLLSIGHSCPQMGPNEATQSRLALRILYWCWSFPSPGRRTGFET